MHQRIFRSVAFMALVSSGAAMAGTSDEGQWLTTFTTGADLPSHGTFQERADGGLADLGDLDPASVGASATTSLRRFSMHDAFGVEPSLGLELGYMTDSNVEPFMKLEYSQLQGRNARIGELASPALSSPATISSKFDDVHSWSLNLGTRYFWTNYAGLKPYLAGFMGVDRTQAMRTHLAVSDVGDLGEAQLLPRQTRFDAGVEGGVSFEFANQADFRLSVGANYVNARKQDSDAFAPLGVDSVKLTEQRWSVPLDLGLNFRF